MRAIWRTGWAIGSRIPSLLREALTHASAGSTRDNQRLEFLGDALLNFTVAFLLPPRAPGLAGRAP